MPVTSDGDPDRRAVETDAWRCEPPGPWADHAACRGRTDEMVIPTSVTVHPTRAGWRSRRKMDAARAICATCPVLAPCRRWALGTPDPAYGMIAGGLSPEQRRLARLAA